MNRIITRRVKKGATFVKITGFLILILFISSPIFAQNLHLIEENRESGYALYRSGKPNADEIREWCKLGISEVMVLSGDAKKVELKYKDECPTLKVIYNHKQDEGVAVSTNFLTLFDKWIKRSKMEGNKILFRCFCGCHRTGRLAAYYQMKYQNISNKDSKVLMNKHGKWMFLYPSLKDQVDALEDYIKGRSCSTEKEYCPSKE